MYRKKNNDNTNISFLHSLAGIMKEVGLTGFIVLIITCIFFLWGSPAQKAEFIDRFVLMKVIDQQTNWCMFIVIILLILLLLTYTYMRWMLKERKAENNRIAKEKSEWQARLLDKELPSSN